MAAVRVAAVRVAVRLVSSQIERLNYCIRQYTSSTQFETVKKTAKG